MDLHKISLQKIKENHAKCGYTESLKSIQNQEKQRKTKKNQEKTKKNKKNKEITRKTKKTKKNQ